MLAQNFKTAVELGLDEETVRALGLVLTMLETDELIYTDIDEPRPNGFNMAECGYENECGTVACIAGWVSKLAPNRGWHHNFPNEAQCRAYGDLIMPPHYRTRKYTVAEAATALRSYLTTGKAEWN